ncbi:unnamed protein product, partial [Nippostrongylus brasiliensis]|uniref:Uncharacterized protein n=1 Tax=Nippostrongylus brasiliensis TaxID=27835 RepID=A0A0N4XR81_NIPBR
IDAKALGVNRTVGEVHHHRHHPLHLPPRRRPPPPPRHPRRVHDNVVFGSPRCYLD